MNTRMKKGTLVVLCLALALAMLLPGCKGSSATPAPTTELKTSEATQPAASADQTQPASGKLFAEPFTIKVMIPDSEPPVLHDSPVIKEIFNRTNVTVDLQLGTVSDYDTKVETLIATGSLPDVTRITHGESYFNDAALNGMFVCISDHADKIPNFSKILAANTEINKTKVDGKFYGFPVLGKWRLQLAKTAVIRADVLTKLNLAVPTTFDELYLTLKGIKAAMPEVIPYTNRNGAKGVMDSLSFSLGSGYGIYFDPDVDGGKYLYGQAHSEFKTALEYVHNLYADGLLDPDYATNTRDAWKEKLSSGKSVFFYDNNTFADVFNGVLHATDANAQLEVLPLMKTASGLKRNIMFQKDWLDQFAINAKVANPANAVTFLDWMYGDEGTLLTNYGVEGEHYQLVGGQPTYLDSVLESVKMTDDPHLYLEVTLGIGLSSFCLNVDEHALAAVSSADLTRWSEMETTANGYVYEVANPPFTADEVDKLKTLLTAVDTLVSQNIDNFIIGTKPMSEYDSFMKSLEEAGALQIESIYNTAYERYKSAN